MRRALAGLLGSALALAAAPLAGAHVTVVPASIEADTTAAVALRMPNERDGHETVGLTVELPEHVEVVQAAAPSGWVVRRSGGTVTWSGGSLGGTGTVDLPLRLRSIGPAGPVLLAASQRYEDGFVSRWQARLTVVPATGSAAPPSHLRRAVAAGVVGIVLVGGSLVVLHLLRRRPS